RADVFGAAEGREPAKSAPTGLTPTRPRAEPAASRVLLLISAGAHTAGSVSPFRAARLAAEHQIRIFTIGVGADALPQQSALSFFWLQSDLSFELDEASLREISHLTGC